MPKVVDHAERRREIVMATWRVIVRNGLANTTTREIAKEAGYSNGVLVHYFKDRDDIMASALVMSHKAVRDRTDIRIRDLRGLSALRLLMIESLPLNEQCLLEAKLEACFWGAAAGNPALMAIHNEEADGFRGRVRRLLEQAAEDGELKPDLDMERAVREFHLLMDGLSLQAFMYPAIANEKQQLELLDALLDRVRNSQEPGARNPSAAQRRKVRPDAERSPTERAGDGLPE